MPLELLSVNGNSADATFFCTERTAVVVEGSIVINLPTLSEAFALIYVLRLSYPKPADTFDTFVQNVIVGLEDGKLRPAGLSLKNDLLAVGQ